MSRDRSVSLQTSLVPDRMDFPRSSFSLYLFRRDPFFSVTICIRSLVLKSAGLVFYSLVSTQFSNPAICLDRQESLLSPPL